MITADEAVQFGYVTLQVQKAAIGPERIAQQVATIEEGVRTRARRGESRFECNIFPGVHDDARAMASILTEKLVTGGFLVEQSHKYWDEVTRPMGPKGTVVSLRISWGPVVAREETA